MLSSTFRIVFRTVCVVRRKTFGEQSVRGKATTLPHLSLKKAPEAGNAHGSKIRVEADEGGQTPDLVD